MHFSPIHTLYLVRKYIYPLESENELGVDLILFAALLERHFKPKEISTTLSVQTLFESRQFNENHLLGIFLAIKRWRL